MTSLFPLKLTALNVQVHHPKNKFHPGCFHGLSYRCSALVFSYFSGDSVYESDAYLGNICNGTYKIKNNTHGIIHLVCSQNFPKN